MAMVKWAPRREWDGLWREFERFVTATMPTMFEPEEHEGDGWRPRLEMHETEAAYVVETDLPGLGKEDLTVEVEGPYVVIKGERHTTHEEPKDGGRRFERTFGKFYRRVVLPETAKAAEAAAHYANGVLTVTVPKTVGAKATRVDVTTA